MTFSGKAVAAWWLQQSKRNFWPRMGCMNQCNHPLKRPHWSCLYCRIRRWHYSKLDPKLWHLNRYLNIVIPKDVKPDVLFLDESRSYVIWRDPNRRLFSFKEAAFKRLFIVCENMELKPSKTYSKGYLFIKKNLVTLLEMMAN